MRYQTLFWYTLEDNGFYEKPKGAKNSHTMMYSFNIHDKDDKEAMDLSKKIEHINFMTEYKILFNIALGVLIFLVLSIMNGSHNHLIALFYGHAVLQVIFSALSAMCLYSGYMAVLNEDGVYKKLNRHLECPVYIKGIDLIESEDNADIDGVEIPQLNIRYDADSKEGRVAVLLQVNETDYKILSIINNDEIGKNKVAIIPSMKLKQALLEVENYDDYVCTLICRINSDKITDNYVSGSEIDNRAVVAEAFYMEMYDDGKD